MLNEERIKVMTRLAVFEKEHGKENEIASKFYKNDYISYHMIWTGIMTTLAYGLGLLLFFLLNYESYMEQMHKMNLFEQGKILIILYICVLVIMETVAWIVYKRKYAAALKSLKEYCDRLHQLERIYNQERHREREYMKQKQEDMKE